MFWTYHLSLDYPLFFALAIIDMEKDKMIDPDFDLSDIIAVSNLLLITYYCISFSTSMVYQRTCLWTNFFHVLKVYVVRLQLCRVYQWNYSLFLINLFHNPTHYLKLIKASSFVLYLQFNIHYAIYCNYYIINLTL